MKTAMIGFKVTEQQKAQLVAIAKKRDITVSQLIRELVNCFLENTDFFMEEE